MSAEEEKRKEGRVPSEQEWVVETARNIQTGNKQVGRREDKKPYDRQKMEPDAQM